MMKVNRCERLHDGDTPRDHEGVNGIDDELQMSMSEASMEWE